MLRCTCCHRWTVEEIVLDGKPVLRVLFMGALPKYFRHLPDLQAWLDPEVFAALEPEPGDGGCE